MVIPQMNRLIVGSVIAAAVITIAPSEARACSCVGGMAFLPLPTPEIHPANAALRRAGCSENLLTYAVTVDGVPATLENADALYPAVSITPAPLPGQEVVVTQCSDEEAPVECPDPPLSVEALRFFAGPDDVEPVPAAGSVTLSHSYHPRPNACDDDDADVEFYVELNELDQGSDTDVAYAVVIDTVPPEGYATLAETRWVGPDAVASLSMTLRGTLDAITIPPEEVCVTVTATDLAGNATLAASACGSTALDEPSPGTDSSGGADSDSDSGADSDASTGEEPVGTTTSDSESSGTGGAAQDPGTTDGGCSCTASPSSAPASLGLLVLGLLGLRRRRVG